MQATITSRGQVTLPKPIRDRLHLKPGDKIDFLLEDDGCLRVAPVTASVRQLKGLLPKPDAPVTLEAIVSLASARVTTRSGMRHSWMPRPPCAYSSERA